MPKKSKHAPSDWPEKFLAALGRTGIVVRAARSAQIDKSNAYKRRKTNAEFAAGWMAALDEAAGRATNWDASAMPPVRSPTEPPGGFDEPPARNWSAVFLRALAETSCVGAAARAARVDTSRAYRQRRDNPRFAAAWRDALAEGYDHLEMETLAYLRGRNVERQIDVPNAVRLLTAHRKTVAEVRAAQAPDDEAEVLASIDELIDRFRREAAAEDARIAAGAAAAATAETCDDERA